MAFFRECSRFQALIDCGRRKCGLEPVRRSNLRTCFAQRSDKGLALAFAGNQSKPQMVPRGGKLRLKFRKLPQVEWVVRDFRNALPIYNRRSMVAAPEYTADSVSLDRLQRVR